MLRNTIFILLLSIIGRTNAVKSQTLHTPAQILEILHKSSVTYTVDSLGNIPVRRKEKILSRSDVNAMFGKKKELPIGAQPKGWSNLNHGDCVKAVKLLVKKSSAYSSLSLDNQLDLCDCMQQSGEWSESIAILLGLQAQYPEHFEIARKLATAYNKTGMTALAYNQILQAWILNRNHSIIQNEALAISASLGREIPEWKWEPKVEISPLGDGAKVSFSPPNSWLAYGLCEAVWAYEPGYAERMRNMSNTDIENIQDTECLMNAIIAYSNDANRGENVPELEALNRAIDQKLTAAFILFEMRLPNQPELAMELTTLQRQQIVTYLESCR